jgi:hypothetical protein
VVVDPELGPAIVAELIEKKKFAPRIRQVNGPRGWSARLRIHGERLCLHLLNHNLQGEAHPTVVGGYEKENLYRINAAPTREPLVLEVDGVGLPPLAPAILLSPDLTAARSVACQSLGQERVQLTFDLTGVRLYAMVVGASS